MKHTVFFAALLLAAPLASAASIVGTLIHGGGIDDMRVEVRDGKGRVVSAYCMAHCGDIFGEPDDNDIVLLKKKFKNRQVKLDYTSEMNRDRIAGPGEERLEFVRKLEFLPASGALAAPGAQRQSTTTTRSLPDRAR